MCTGKCSRFIAIALYPLALVSVICNIMLFFPGWETKWVSEEGNGENRITPEVKYMGGLIGGGIMVLVPAIHIHLTGKKGCCANRCGMFLSIGFAALGVAGAIYSLSVASVGLANGPVCSVKGTWTRPFLNDSGSYLSDRESWAVCTEPKDVVEFNLGLFATLLLVACVELLLCGFQMVNGLFGCLCGTCNEK
ncbi:transmembrane 4 L6 family member 5 [Chanos chanos]|uniref:Transmembrane 4 L6 family member 5 n=1 Tax=Chanos chanos TaxID=29144 RepID=A0A6J2VXM4_CHACN|nr:transmembrane 4 L6 family member 5-like [Chanos chanos]